MGGIPQKEGCKNGKLAETTQNSYPFLSAKTSRHSPLALSIAIKAEIEPLLRFLTKPAQSR